MASDSQIQSHSIFGRDRRRGTIGEDTQNVLVDSDVSVGLWVIKTAPHLLESTLLESVGWL